MVKRGMRLQSSADTNFHDAVNVKLDEWRGDEPSRCGKPTFNKDFAIAYDRMICLVAGQYELKCQTIAWAEGSPDNQAEIRINGNRASYTYSAGGSGEGHSSAFSHCITSLVRGDYIIIKGGWFNDENYSNFSITKLS